MNGRGKVNGEVDNYSSVSLGRKWSQAILRPRFSSDQLNQLACTQEGGFRGWGVFFLGSQ
jgi:hypothetical protein